MQVCGWRAAALLLHPHQPFIAHLYFWRFVVLKDPVVPLGLGQLQCGMPDPSQLRLAASISIVKC